MTKRERSIYETFKTEEEKIAYKEYLHDYYKEQSKYYAEQKYATKTSLNLNDLDTCSSPADDIAIEDSTEYRARTYYRK